MLHQPCHISQSVRRSLHGARASLRPTGTTTPLFSAAALLDQPADTIANLPIPVESPLLVAFVILTGILGLSAALLYRHMHRVEEQLRLRAENAEAELRALSMMTDDAVLVIAPDGTVRGGNPAAEEVFGRRSEDFIGRSLSELIAQPLCLPELTKNGPVNFETTARRPGDEFTRVEMLMTAVELNGRTSYLALIHERRAPVSGGPWNTTPPPADHTKAIETFTHDLNNHLTSIIGNMSLVLMSPPTDPANHERLVNAKKTALRAQTLSQSLQTSVTAESPGREARKSDQAAPRTIVPMPVVKPPPHTHSATPPPPQRPKILILDDEEAICSLVAVALTSIGFEVTEATSVDTAIRACEDAERAARPYDLVISDLCLPGDIAGSEAVSRLRSINPHIKAIVSSGYDNDPIMRDCRKHGFAAAIAKPYEISKLGRTVREVLAADGAETRKSA